MLRREDLKNEPRHNPEDSYLLGGGENQGREGEGLSPSSTFWQDFSLLLDEHYSLSGVKYFVISGDGAPWVKEGTEYFSPSIYQLDRFHLKRAITRVLRGKEAQEIYSLLISQDLQGALNHLQKMQEEASKERKKEIEGKKRGMGWSKRGANSLAKVIALRKSGELEDCLAQKYRAESIPSSVTKRVKERLRKEVGIRMEVFWERFTY